MRVFASALLLTALLVFASCGRQSETGISVDRALKPLVPPDTKVLAGIDLDKLKAAPFYQRHKELDWNQLTRLQDSLGLDPTRDLSKVLIAWNGKQSLVLVRGAFNPKAVEERLGALAGRRSSYKHHDLIGNDAASVAFFKKGIAAEGSAGLLRAIIDLDASGGGGIPPELTQQLERMPAADQIWAVSRGGLPFADVPMRSDIASALSNIVGYISSATAGVSVNTGTNWQAEITCVSDQGAQRVRDALRGGIGLARLTTRDDQLDQLRLYDAIHVDQDHQLVHIRADLSADLMDKLLSILTHLGTPARQAPG